MIGIDITDKEQDAINRTSDFARDFFESDASGHDWWHTQRVWKLAKGIAEQEKADLFVVEMAALLHDVSDFKLHGGDVEAGKRKVIDWLIGLELEEMVINHIWNAVNTVSYKGAGVDTTPATIEAMIVQDADRLDAMGAMGVARTLAFGGNRGRKLWDPSETPEQHQSFEAYKNSQSSTVSHFYEKLLLLKDRINTETAKRIAERRHQYMEEFLERFFQEWEGKDLV